MTFALSALNTRLWVGFEFCPCILLCLTSVPSWCHHHPRVRVLRKIRKLQPELDHSAEQHWSFEKGSFFQWLLHTQPYHDSAPSNHSAGSSWGVAGKQKSGNYCCWRQYFAECWPKANSWPLLTNTAVSLFPSLVPKDLNILGILTALFSFDSNFVMQVNSHSYSSSFRLQWTGCINEYKAVKSVISIHGVSPKIS